MLTHLSPRRLVALSVIAVLCSCSMVQQHSRPGPPSGFVIDGPTSSTESITLRIALANNNLDGLESKLLAISDPSSSEYGQFLTQDEVKSFLEPSSATTAAFDSWAASNGLSPTVISPNNDWVQFTTTISQANRLFAAQFTTFTETASNLQIVRTLDYSIDSSLVDHVLAVHPTSTFTTSDARLAPTVYWRRNIEARNKNGYRRDDSPDKDQPSKSAVPASCNVFTGGTITPACLQALYDIPTTPATQKNNTLLVTGYEGQFPQTADLSQFLQELRPDIDPATSFALAEIDGGQDPQNATQAGSEADLDTQYTIGIATGVPVTFLSVGGDNTNADFATSLLDTTTFLQQTANPPSVMSTSYGNTEFLFDPNFIKVICNSYMALGARGISAIFSSGDGGVRGHRDTLPQCANNTFAADFPSACPFITAVGSTLGIEPEIAINFTGGGFSDVFPQPAYQKNAVASFLNSLPRDFEGIFNRSGRGYPDVAVQGKSFEVVIGRENGLVGGTSASTPTFAAIIALINDRLVAAGKPVLGFLNPWIYTRASSAFTDITAGKNSGAVCPANSSAFTATKGWDPLTGFGTPQFNSLLKAAGL